MIPYLKQHQGQDNERVRAFTITQCTSIVDSSSLYYKIVHGLRKLTVQKQDTLQQPRPKKPRAHRPVEVASSSLRPKVLFESERHALD